MRGRLDRELQVVSWRVPGTPSAGDTTPTRRVVDVGGDQLVAPPWWRGEEDASQSFLAAMGVTLDG